MKEKEKMVAKNQLKKVREYFKKHPEIEKKYEGLAEGFDDWRDGYNCAIEYILDLINEEIKGYKIFVGDKNFKQFVTKKVIKVLNELKSGIEK